MFSGQRLRSVKTNPKVYFGRKKPSVGRITDRAARFGIGLAYCTTDPKQVAKIVHAAPCFGALRKGAVSIFLTTARRISVSALQQHFHLCPILADLC